MRLVGAKGRLDVAVAELFERVAFPRLGLPAVVGQGGGAKSQPQPPEPAARLVDHQHGPIVQHALGLAVLPAIPSGQLTRTRLFHKPLRLDREAPPGRAAGRCATEPPWS
jgi:hypothetical protein